MLSKETFFHQKTPFYSNVLSSVTCALKKDTFFRGLICRVSCFLEKPIFCSKLLSVARHFLWKLCGFFFRAENYFLQKTIFFRKLILKQVTFYSKILFEARQCLKQGSVCSKLFLHQVNFHKKLLVSQRLLLCQAPFCSFFLKWTAFSFFLRQQVFFCSKILFV